MVVQSWDLNHKIVHFRLNPANPREAIVVVRKQKKAEAGGTQTKKSSTTSVLYRLDLDTTKLVRVAKARHYEAMAVSPTGRFVAVASGKKLLLCAIDGSNSTERTFTHDLDITTIDFHPTASYLAYGDSNGRISLLYFMTGTDGQAPLTSVMHWHAHKVAALRFTSDGEQLLSGGEESVLVVWHLQSRQKSFLPRLGSEVASLQMSPDGQMYGVGLADNSVKVVMASNLAVKQSVEGMRFGGLRDLSGAGEPTFV
jgi:NET1-associated nuclear protein 1 (U3 small nucleolar RNA-associated protein 17)